MQPQLLHLPLLHPILHQHLPLPHRMLLLQLPLMPLPQLHHTPLPQLHHTPLLQLHHTPLLQLLLLLLRMNMVPRKRLSKMSTDLLRRLFQTDMPHHPLQMHMLHHSLLMQLQQVFQKTMNNIILFDYSFRATTTWVQSVCGRSNTKLGRSMGEI